MEQRQPTPIRVMLDEISEQTAPAPAPRGLVPPAAVDQFTRLSAIISVVLASATLLTMIWGGVDLYLGLKTLGSISVVMLSILVFRAVNTLFG